MWKYILLICHLFATVGHLVVQWTYFKGIGAWNVRTLLTTPFKLFKTLAHEGVAFLTNKVVCLGGDVDEFATEFTYKALVLFGRGAAPDLKDCILGVGV